MKTEVILPLLFLVIGVSAQYNMIRGPIYPFGHWSSQDVIDLLSKRSRSDFDVITGTTNKQLRSQRLLNILKRTTAYNHDGNIPTDRYSFLVHEQSAQKRACDTRRITIETILEYLRSGRICGFRVSTFRFGLGGKKRRDSGVIQRIETRSNTLTSEP